MRGMSGGWWGAALILGLGLGLSWPTVAAAADEPTAERLAAAGIRRVEGKHVVLFADLDADVCRELVAVFDAAYPQWCRWFGIEPAADRPFRSRACVMTGRPRFQAVGLWDARLPEFRNGYCLDSDFWMFDQPQSAYYRRHLLLHEGVHAFMNHHLGGCGPTWCMEATAELLATHRLAESGGELRLPFLPDSREHTPLWGRIDTLESEVAAGRALTRGEVWNLPPGSHLKPETYAWCWGMGAFLENHPRYRDRFRSWVRQARDPDFNALGEAYYKPDLAWLDVEWNLFVSDCGYGYDFERNALEPPNQPLAAPIGDPWSVRADRGRQVLPLRVEQGKTYDVTAEGRFELAQTFRGKPRPWVSEPNGITFRRHRGRPLGELQVSVWPESFPPGTSPALTKPEPIGTSARWTAPATGTLLFHLNDHPGERSDNRGTATVRIRPAGP